MEKLTTDQEERMRDIEAKMAVDDKIKNSNMTEDEAEVLRNKLGNQTNYDGMSPIGREYMDELDTGREKSLMGGVAIKDMPPIETTKQRLSPGGQLQHDEYGGRGDIDQFQLDEYEKQLLDRGL